MPSLTLLSPFPAQVLFLAAGYACSNRILNSFLAFAVALNVSLVTFVIGASIAFLLARRVLPPSCTRKFFRHYAILEGEANTAVRPSFLVVVSLRSGVPPTHVPTARSPPARDFWKRAMGGRLRMSGALVAPVLSGWAV